ncbi:MAG: AI-2E family transporter [Bacteroidetes bacterium]|nr:MAG: AI-2E family transporter [Bacteroidota bacterium]
MLENDMIHPNKIRQILMLALVLALGFVLYGEMAFMLSAFLGAVALYMLLRRAMFKMVFGWKWRSWIAALLLVLGSLVLVVMPFVFVINILIKKLTPFIEDQSQITDAIKRIEGYLSTRFHIEILSDVNVEKIELALTNAGKNVLGSTVGAITNLVVMYFLLWFMLTNGGNMERWLRKNLPFKSTNTAKLLQEVNSMVVSNAVGIPLLGTIQGIIATIGYYLFGINEPILWGIITGIASVIPFVGTMAVWVPIVILQFAAGNMQTGYWLIFWGLVPIGSSDNVIRFVLQKSLADVHPLITVFGVIVGLNLFGFLGLIFGPLLLSLFLLLVRVYKDEFGLAVATDDEDG